MIAGRQKDNIPEAAYLIWETEGRPHGRDMEHWLQAENLVTGVKRKSDKTADKSPDDLKKISGVGPVMAKKLQSLGITSYAQIAAFDDVDIDRIGAELKCKGKMRQYDWVGQAKKLS